MNYQIVLLAAFARELGARYVAMMEQVRTAKMSGDPLVADMHRVLLDSYVETMAGAWEAARTYRRGAWN